MELSQFSSEKYLFICPHPLLKHSFRPYLYLKAEASHPNTEAGKL
jgi:hypothetical protein